MKHRKGMRFLAIMLCAALVLTLTPVWASPANPTVSMTAGDVIAGFAAAGTDCVSEDPAVAWVDENGTLNALKAGETSVTVDGVKHEVTVSPYTDGTPVVGQLKLLARYNDDMQFYDGHVYLLFTSYQDGLEIPMEGLDLYGAYEISPQYYEDIREDISVGSNHTGNDAEKYFTFTDSLESMTLNRGEIVTIGMYRGFDLTITDAVLGTIQSSSGWKNLGDAGKKMVVRSLYSIIESGNLDPARVWNEIQTVAGELDMDYRNLLNGVTEGGLCFNRELYNQKLEWDQYENVTYELDITAKQLQTMMAYLHGNLNNFSILKNSCATVALRAWNGAIGSRDGQATAYHLDPTGTGIFSLIDAPKTVRDAIRDRLPGYYLNNSDEVREPNASFTDDTGEVYVSAPEKVEPVTYKYVPKHSPNPPRFDQTRTSLTGLVNHAKAGKNFFYDKEKAEITIDVKTTSSGGVTTISQIDFQIDAPAGNTVSLNKDNFPEEGAWFTVPAVDANYVVDKDGNTLPSEYSNGAISFFISSLPATYRIIYGGGAATPKNVLKTSIMHGEEAYATTEVYYYSGQNKVDIDGQAELSSGTPVYVKAAVSAEDSGHVLSDITLNGSSVLNYYDANECAYKVTMPAKYSELKVIYEPAVIQPTGNTLGDTLGLIQVPAGEGQSVTDYATLLMGKDQIPSDRIRWKALDDEGHVLVSPDGKTMTVEDTGNTDIVFVMIVAEDNPNISYPFMIDPYDADADMVSVSYDQEIEENAFLTADFNGKRKPILYSGYLTPKGSALNITPKSASGVVASSVTFNGRSVSYDTPLVADSDATVSAEFRSAKITGMPRTVRLDSKGDTYQLEAKLKYSGILTQFLPVYNPVLHYESSDERISVDDNGLITVKGEVPEDGFTATVTVLADANKSIYESCQIVVGDYDDARIVGSLTIYARPSQEGQWVAHSALVFMPYEDTDLRASLYKEFVPNWKYERLLLDYEKHPENYTQDPALYNNDLELLDRGSLEPESYFDLKEGSEEGYGAKSDPQTISLRKGECITISSFSEPDNISTVLFSLMDLIGKYPPAADLLTDVMTAYLTGSVDGMETDIFDNLVKTLVYMYQYYQATGVSPANGQVDGGANAFKEIYNQFKGHNSQLPNNYYSAEITAAELANLEKELADPENNYYSLFNKNCTAASVYLWNKTFADVPDLHIDADYTGFAVDPESLYVNLGLMRLRPGLPGSGGKDFYPRWDVSDPETWDRKWPFDGALTITAKNQEITQGEGIPAWTNDSYTVSEDLYSKDVLNSVSVSYQQNGVVVTPTTPGVYDIVPGEPVILDENGRDVTESYNIRYVPGKLTVKSPPDSGGGNSGSGGDSGGSGGGSGGDSGGSGGADVTETYTVDLDCDGSGSIIATKGEAEQGETITLTVEAYEGWKIDTVTVIDKKKNEVALTDKGDGVYTFQMPASNVTVTAVFTEDSSQHDAVCPSKAFDDLDTSLWYHEGTDYVLSEGIMNGVGEKQFDPNGTTTRAMIVTMLWRMSFSERGDYDEFTFEDVEKGSWYEDAVKWAAHYEIVKGYDKKTFAPYDPITREQFATILFRYAEYEKKRGEAFEMDMSKFEDLSSVSEWALDAMTWCVGAGIISGVTETTLVPQGKATRAQAATMLMRFDKTM